MTKQESPNNQTVINQQPTYNQSTTDQINQ